MRNNDVSVCLKANSNIYDMKRYNGMTFIHENEVNKISKCNLLHAILNPSKHTTTLNIH